MLRPSDITQKDCDIYLLHVEILERGARAMDHTAHSGTVKSVGTATPLLDFALDYSKAMPKQRYDYNLIVAVHTSSQVDGRRDRRAASILTEFYRRLLANKIYQRGERFLQILGA